MDKIKNFLIGENWQSLLINVLLMLGIGTALVLGFFYVYMPATTNHGVMITVPDVTNMTYEKAGEVLAKHSLRYAVYDSGAVNYRSDLPPNTVLSQTPPPNEQVKENRKIYFRINPTNPPLVNIPDIINSSLKNAYIRLRNLGIKIGRIQRVPDPDNCRTCSNIVLKVVYEGEEIDKELVSQGYKILKGKTVDLIVSDGLGNTTAEVPQLKGMSYEEAEFVLVGMGLGVGKVRYVETDTIPNVVLKQYPSRFDEDGSKRKIRLGRVVDLWITEESSH
ncbi:PASTA domain-containing protein [Algivirga pacifica]|uniref:PASTA domain-containing protein n=1 Tax=Algivirga pacifica TaxID=1162670 RepID=A0ABP9DKZ3_9BACT